MLGDTVLRPLSACVSDMIFNEAGRQLRLADPCCSLLTSLQRIPDGAKPRELRHTRRRWWTSRWGDRNSGSSAAAAATGAAASSATSDLHAGIGCVTPHMPLAAKPLPPRSALHDGASCVKVPGCAAAGFAGRQMVVAAGQAGPSSERSQNHYQSRYQDEHEVQSACSVVTALAASDTKGSSRSGTARCHCLGFSTSF